MRDYDKKFSDKNRSAAKYDLKKVNSASPGEQSQVNSLMMGTWGCDVITQYPSLMMNREFFSVPPLSIIKRAHLVFSVTQDRYKNSMRILQ